MQQAQEPRTSGRTPHVPTAGSILQHLAAKKLSKWSTCDSWPWQNRQHRFSGTTCATQCVVVFLATKAGTGSTPAQAKVISFVWFVKNIQKLVFRLGILFAARCCSHDSYTHAADASSNQASRKARLQWHDWPIRLEHLGRSWKVTLNVKRCQESYAMVSQSLTLEGCA